MTAGDVLRIVLTLIVAAVVVTAALLLLVRSLIFAMMLSRATVEIMRAFQ